MNDLPAVPPWFPLDGQTSRSGGDESEPRERVDVDAILAGVPEGEREFSLVRLSGRLHYDHLSLQYAEHLVRLAAANCTPPFPEEEALERVRRVYRDLDAKNGHRSSPTAATAPRLLSLDEFLTLPPQEFLIDDVLTKGGFSLLEGNPSSYKSFIALAMGLSVATGQPWATHGVLPGTVLYVVGEGRGGFARRCAAWVREPGREGQITNFYLHDGAVALRQPDAIEVLITTLGDRGVKPDLIVLDTLNRCFGGGDENSSKDMGEFIAGCDHLREATGAHVLVVHHLNKAGSTRGHSSLNGSLDTEILAERVADLVAVTCKKQKDGAEFDKLTFKSREVELDEFNTSLVLDLAPGTLTLLETRRRVLETLARYGSDGATHATWKGAAISAGVSKSTFSRARQELLDAKVVVHSGTGKGGRYCANLAAPAAETPAEQSRDGSTGSDGSTMGSEPIGNDGSMGSPPLRGEPMNPTPDPKIERAPDDSFPDDAPGPLRSRSGAAFWTFEDMLGSDG